MYYAMSDNLSEFEVNQSDDLRLDVTKIALKITLLPHHNTRTKGRVNNERERTYLFYSFLP